MPHFLEQCMYIALSGFNLFNVCGHMPAADKISSMT